jgi:hypothetical protein
MKLFFSPDYVAAAESFDTTRKSGWIAESLEKNPVQGVDIVAPTSLNFEEIAWLSGSVSRAILRSRRDSTGIPECGRR